MNPETQNTHPLYVERTFMVRTYDIDFAGHVNNITYVRWLEDLRLAVLDDYYPLEDLMEQGYGPILIRTEVDYKSAIRLFEPVTGRMWATGADIVKMHLQAEFSVGDRLCAAAKQSGVMVTLETGRPIRLPADLRAMIQGGETSASPDS